MLSAPQLARTAEITGDDVDAVAVVLDRARGREPGLDPPQPRQADALMSLRMAPIYPTEI
jgi:hypothetical protein